MLSPNTPGTDCSVSKDPQFPIDYARHLGMDVLPKGPAQLWFQRVSTAQEPQSREPCSRLAEKSEDKVVDTIALFGPA